MFFFPDPKEAITFLEKTKEKVGLQEQTSQQLPARILQVKQSRFLSVQVKSSEEAVILCKTSIGSLKLEINDLPATKVKPPNSLLRAEAESLVTHF